jgi:hypothetical protein
MTWASNWLSNDAVWQWLTEGREDEALMRRTLWEGGQEGLGLGLAPHGQRRWVPSLTLTLTLNLNLKEGEGWTSKADRWGPACG